MFLQSINLVPVSYPPLLIWAECRGGGVWCLRPATGQLRQPSFLPKPSKLHKEAAWESWESRLQRQWSIKWDGGQWINCFSSNEMENPINRMGLGLVDNVLFILSEEKCRGTSLRDLRGHPQAWAPSLSNACVTIFPLFPVLLSPSPFQAWNYLPNNMLETKSLFQALVLRRTPTKVGIMETASEWRSDRGRSEPAGQRWTVLLAEAKVRRALAIASWFLWLFLMTNWE